MTTSHSVLSFSGPKTMVLMDKDPFEDPTTFSLCIWAKPGILNDYETHSMVGKQVDDWLHQSPSLGMVCADNDLLFDAFAPDGQRFLELVTGFFEQKEWVHIAWVKRGTKFEIYRNGRLVAERPAPAAISTVGNGYSIGFVDYHWVGELAELRIFKIALSKEQIQKDFRRRLNGNEPGLVAYLPLDEGSGNIAHDKSDRQNHGTILGATWTQSELPLLGPDGIEFWVEHSKTTPGSNITLFWNSPTPFASNAWIGLYPDSKAADTAYLSFLYIPAGTSGSIQYGLPKAASETYEFRLFPFGGYDRRGTSIRVIAQEPPCLKLFHQGGMIEPGGKIGVDWCDATEINSSGWVGLYEDSNAPDNAYLSFQYVTPGESGSLTFKAPDKLGDNYEFRMFPIGGYARKITVGAISVYPPKSLQFSASPLKVPPGGTITVRWTDVRRIHLGSGVALFANSTADTGEALQWQYTSGVLSPTGHLDFKMPETISDTYEFRFYPTGTDKYQATPVRVAVVPPETPVKKPTEEKPAAPKPADDMTKIRGIGPKISELLAAAGISTYAQLMAAEIGRLKEILTAGGPRFATADPTSWPEQARLLAEGKLGELKELQAKLKQES